MSSMRSAATSVVAGLTPRSSPQPLRLPSLKSRSCNHSPPPTARGSSMDSEALALEQAQAKASDHSAQKTAQPKPAPAKAAAPAAKTEAKRTDSFLYGIPQLGTTHVDRQVPISEPPPLAANPNLKFVGKPTPRYDGALKVTGSGKYTADIHLPGMLYAHMAGAAVPHGRIISIDTTAAEKLPGDKAVHAVQHVLGVAELRDPSKEIPSRYPIIRYYGCLLYTS